jgi:hypothetical protein
MVNNIPLLKALSVFNRICGRVEVADILWLSPVRQEPPPLCDGGELKVVFAVYEGTEGTNGFLKVDDFSRVRHRPMG